MKKLMPSIGLLGNLIGIGLVLYFCFTNDLMHINGAYAVGGVVGGYLAGFLYAFILVLLYRLIKWIIVKIWKSFLWIIREISRTIKEA